MTHPRSALAALLALALLGGPLAIGTAGAAGPAELAPGAPELLDAQGRLDALLVTSRAVAAATSRLQVAWTLRVPPKEDPCEDAERLGIGWRVERFGAAWREAAQAARAQAERVRRIRAAPTVAPLVDARWAAQLDALDAEAARQGKAFLESSAWQTTYVRPVLGACPVPPVAADPGIEMVAASVRGEPDAPVAVLAVGDGWVCPGGIRADDAVVLVEGGAACWSASQGCGCTPVPVFPGAVVGPPKEPAGDVPELQLDPEAAPAPSKAPKVPAPTTPPPPPSPP